MVVYRFLWSLDLDGVGRNRPLYLCFPLELVPCSLGVCSSVFSCSNLSLHLYHLVTLPLGLGDLTVAQCMRLLTVHLFLMVSCKVKHLVLLLSWLLPVLQCYLSTLSDLIQTVPTKDGVLYAPLLHVFRIPQIKVLFEEMFSEFTNQI